MNESVSTLICEYYSDKKGFGYVAKTDILNNDLILKENPVVLIQKKGRSYNYAVSKMIFLLITNKKYKKKFDNFCPSTIDHLCITQKKASEIINDIKNDSLKTYLLSLQVNDFILYYEKIKRNVFECGDSLFVIFIGTKFNHACDPNINYYFDNTREGLTSGNTTTYSGGISHYGNKSLKFCASKDIKCGEELTISYIGNDMNKSYLLNTFGFKCDCSLCKT